MNWYCLWTLWQNCKVSLLSTFQNVLLISINRSFAYLWTSSNGFCILFFSMWKDVLPDNQGWISLLSMRSRALQQQTTINHYIWVKHQYPLGMRRFPILILLKAFSSVWSRPKSSSQNCIKANKSYTVECLHAIQFCWMAKGEIWYGWWSSQIKASP